MKTPPVKAHLNSSQAAAVAVLARALALPSSTASAGEFVFMPPGENVIEATVNGKGEKITVIVDASTAAALQADLTARLATGIRPALDYNHEGGRASGWPTGFRWMDGSGVICEVEWTPVAVAAIRDGEWLYFSPEFRYDRKTKRVLGLPVTGPVGGLVNDPAFRAMPAVQARNISTTSTEEEKQSPPEETGPPPPTTTPTQYQRMKLDTIVAALAAAGILSETEAAADNAPALLASRIADLKAGDSIKASLATAHTAALTEKDSTISALREQLDAAATATATAAVEAAIKAGRIAPKDEAAKAFWLKNLKENPEAATVLASLATPAALKPLNLSPTEMAEQKVPLIVTAAAFEAMSNKEKMDFSVNGGRIKSEA